MKMILMSSLCVIVQQIDNNSFLLSCWLTSHIYMLHGVELSKLVGL